MSRISLIHRAAAELPNAVCPNGATPTVRSTGKKNWIVDCACGWLSVEHTNRATATVDALMHVRDMTEQVSA